MKKDLQDSIDSMNEMDMLVREAHTVLMLLEPDEGKAQDRIDSMNEMERKSRKAQDMLDDAGIER